MEVEPLKEGPTVHVYQGREKANDYHAAVMAVEEGTISPGGAADRLGCSRQYVHKLINLGKLETWVYYERRGTRATGIDIAYRDVLKYLEERKAG